MSNDIRLLSVPTFADAWTDGSSLRDINLSHSQLQQYVDLNTAIKYADINSSKGINVSAFDGEAFIDLVKASKRQSIPPERNYSDQHVQANGTWSVQDQSNLCSKILDPILYGKVDCGVVENSQVKHVESVLRNTRIGEVYCNSLFENEITDNDLQWGIDMLCNGDTNSSTPKSTRTTTTTGSVAVQSPRNLSISFPHGNYVAGSLQNVSPQSQLSMKDLENSLLFDERYTPKESHIRASSKITENNLCTQKENTKMELNLLQNVAVSHSTACGVSENGSSPSLQVMLVKAKGVADSLVLDFKNFSDPDPTNKAVEVLKTALAMLGHSFEAEGEGEGHLQGIGGPNFSAPTMLAHPDEFKNPSSFLKIYGDPLCGSSSFGTQNPLKGQNGNWICGTCGNVNFPRRFRCNKCSDQRNEEGDKIVTDYAKAVYHQHLYTYKQLATNPKTGKAKTPESDMLVVNSANAMNKINLPHLAARCMDNKNMEFLCTESANNRSGIGNYYRNQKQKNNKR